MRFLWQEGLNRIWTASLHTCHEEGPEFHSKLSWTSSSALEVLSTCSGENMFFFTQSNDARTSHQHELSEYIPFI